MKNLFLLLIVGLLVMNNAQAQDSLAHYSKAQIDSLFHLQKTHKAKLPYAVALVAKVGESLGTQDTTYAKALNRLAVVHKNLGNFDKSLELSTQALNIYTAQGLKMAVMRMP